MLTKKIICKIKKSLVKKTKKELKKIIIKYIIKEKKNEGLTFLNSTAKEKILLRDNNECVMCGDKHNLEVHHFKPKLLRKNKYDGWRVTLCKYCHWYLHANPKYRIYSSDLVKATIIYIEGKAYSYKGNKWGRKKLSKQMRTKIKECIIENPKMSLRDIANKVGLSKSVVHKYSK